ncbi:PREDICTED: cysteine-rich receptor-like protein kinase 37 [Camelina sativa]|uniref:Cysteine-rich receptor-like protein kinase 37 n=1 Tax=Camelina sativa TaxID=90675 RepID=A0ABM0Y6M3_CAMSA|nr:PREDICTED: cysteine-rich receptor-like protein kinase 37 [Camelina sativa]
MGKSCLVATFLSLLLLFLQTPKYVNAGFICYGDVFNVSYGVSRDYFFSSLPTNVVSNGNFYNGSFGRDSKNNRVHVVALCRRGYETLACKTCLEHVIDDTKSRCPRQNSFSWVTDESDDISCSLRYTNRSTFGKLELSPVVINTNPNNINSSIFEDMILFSQEWIAMVNRTLEAASTADTSSVLKYYNATKKKFTQISDVYAFMQCTPDLSPGDCKRCLRECVYDFQRQYWGKQGGAVSRPSCYFRWDLYPYYKAFDDVTRVPALSPQASSTILNGVRDKKSFQGFQGSNIVIMVVPTVINLLIFVVLILSWKRKPSHTGMNEASDSSDGQSMVRFDLGMIFIATNNFSSEKKLGQGGFGSVYKGVLPSGQEIAVKRLTKGSGQGDMQFKNEVLLLTRLQHRNLVKLLGFCNEKDEEILVYEFVPNSSLDCFIFDEEKRRILTWDVRYTIIEGVARGLQYLHEDSQLRIIHRDLKASNILLDAEMNPKVADFGMARLFNMDETRGQTSRVVGTYGYMAPEYATYGQFSAKSDVYCFGVMLLEMICGKRNKNLEKEEDEEEELSAFVWKRWIEGRFAEIIDPWVAPSKNISTNEVVKLIHIGLLCVQENVSKRPSMTSILFWLERHANTTMPLPTPVAFLTRLSSSLPQSPSSSP